MISELSLPTERTQYTQCEFQRPLHTAGPRLRAGLGKESGPTQLAKIDMRVTHLSEPPVNALAAHTPMPSANPIGIGAWLMKRDQSCGQNGTMSRPTRCVNREL